MLRSDLCDYSDVYIVVKGEITVKGNDNANKRNRKLIFKNNAPFRSCISKINDTFIDIAEDLDIVIPMHAYQKSMIHSLTMQKILILLFPCIIY